MKMNEEKKQTKKQTVLSYNKITHNLNVLFTRMWAIDILKFCTSINPIR